ncbi:MAG: 5-formyltetrahydrofolate cyclo-ligase [Chitinophagaceae bacterium]
MTKKALRRRFRDERARLSINEVTRLDDLLLIRFQQWPVDDIRILLSYWPIPEKAEVNTHLMVDYLSFRISGLQLAFPVIDISTHQLMCHAVQSDTLYRNNQLAITEPVNGEQIPVEEIDAVFVPLLAFDKRGFRVGYGKGFYDRFLSSCREDVLKIGFSYFEPVDVIDDINDFDVPLSVCITPNKIYEF